LTTDYTDFTDSALGSAQTRLHTFLTPSLIRAIREIRG